MPDGATPGRRGAPRPAHSAARRWGPTRVTWLLLGGIFLVMAIAVPVKIAAKQASPADSAGGAAAVHMAGLKFAPIALVVKKGTTVVFANNDVAPHTVTEDGAGGIDSGIVSPGRSFRLVVARRLVYHCAIHPFMKATIEIAG